MRKQLRDTRKHICYRQNQIQIGYNERERERCNPQYVFQANIETHKSLLPQNQFGSHSRKGGVSKNEHNL